MKKFYLIIAFAALGLAEIQAQQVPLYSNYFFTPYVYNPARSGSSGVTEASLVHRRMWTNVQGSPETSALTLNGALNKEKIGYSIYAYTDRTDILSRSGIYGAYAYHLQLSDKNYLSFGMAAGYLNNSIDLGRVNASSALDPVLFITPNNRGVFDLNAGVNLRIADFQLGVAVPQLLGSPVKYTENYNGQVFYQLIRHYIGQVQYDLKLEGDRMTLSPFLMFRAAEAVPFQYDIGAMFNMKKFGFVGASFRSDYAFTANIGLHLTEQLSMGYAHDFSTNAFASQLGTSNEFMLTYKFGNNSKNDRLENEIKKLKENDKKKTQQYEDLIRDRLDEFRDEMKKMQEKDKEEIERLRNEGGVENPNNSPNDQGNTANPNNNQNRNNNRANNNPNNPNNAGNNQNSGQNSTGTNQGGGTGSYPQSNQASSVQPGEKGYYVVAGVYSSEANALRMVQNITGQNQQARFFRDSSSGFYYVYLLRFDNYRAASQAKNSGLNGGYNGELWIKIID